MRVKVASRMVKKAKEDEQKKAKWHAKAKVSQNNRRVINIADLGNKSYLGREWFRVPDIPGNEKYKILD